MSDRTGKAVELERWSLDKAKTLSPRRLKLSAFKRNTKCEIIL
jgi:hypothetical protein